MKYAGLLLFCLVISVSPVRSQWVPSDGLYSSAVGSIVSHKGALYAGGNPGLFRSTDFGMNWTAVESRRLGNNLEIAASVNSLFVCTPKVIRSTDAGATWKTLLLAAGDTLVAEKVFTVDNLLIAATAKNGLFRSTDDGDTWIAATDSLRAYDIVAAIGKLYAGTDSGAYISTDSGMNWKRVGLRGNKVNALAANDAYLFAMTKDSGFFRSTDGGENWASLYMSDGSASQKQVIAVHDSTVFVAEGNTLYWSFHNGTVIEDAKQFGGVNCISILDGSVFVGTGGIGTYRAAITDSLEWQPCQMSDHKATTFLRVDSILYAGTNSRVGILGSLDSGIRWFDRSTGYAKSPGFSFPKIQHLIAHNGVLILHDLFSGTYRSTDGGALWKPIESQLVYNSSQLGTPIALLSRDSTLFAGATDLRRSTDLGKSWQLDSLKTGPVTIASLSGSLFVGTEDYRNRLLRSTDDGATWALLNSFPWSSVLRLATSDALLYATARELDDLMMLCSSDGGDSWKDIRLPRRIHADSLYSFYVTAETNIYLAFNKGLYFSSNTGASWKPIGDGLPNNIAQTVIVDGDHLVAGSFNGLWRRPLQEVLARAGVDVALEIDERQSKIATDGTVTLVATITNQTPNILTNVTLRDTIAGLELISHSLTGGGVHATDSMITASIALLESGKQVVYTSVGKLKKDGLHRRRPIVEPSEPELVPANNFDLFEVYWGGASVQRLPFDDARITHLSQKLVKVSGLTGQHITARMYNILGQLISTNTFGSVHNGDIELELPVDVTVLELYDGTLPIMKRIVHWR